MSIEKFRNKYTIKSDRLEGYDYSQNGIYFVTICAKNREYFFGSIENGRMCLTDIGKIANEFWKEIPKHFPFVILDEFIVMPNHVHGIIEICNKADACRDEALPRLYIGKYPLMSKMSPKQKSLSVIVGSFKAVVSKISNKKFPDVNFQWQSRFYDHIIRNDESLDKIREYVQINPKMWEQDKNKLEASIEASMEASKL